MREVCNSGYGRHGCEQFPAGSPWDAIRFHVAKDAGTLIQIQYVFEKDCWPVEHGTLDCDSAVASVQLAGEILRRQADAFVESYLRRRGQV